MSTKILWRSVPWFRSYRRGRGTWTRGHDDAKVMLVGNKDERTPKFVFSVAHKMCLSIFSNLTFI